MGRSNQPIFHLRTSISDSQPGFEVLLKLFLRAQRLGHDEDRTVGKPPLKQRGDEGLRGSRHARQRQCAALLDALTQGLHSGSFNQELNDSGANRVGRLGCQSAPNVAGKPQPVKRALDFEALSGAS